MSTPEHWKPASVRHRVVADAWLPNATVSRSVLPTGIRCSPRSRQNPSSTWKTLCQQARARAGAGFALIKALAEICVDRGYPRFEWLAMEDNEAGQKFYSHRRQGEARSRDMADVGPGYPGAGGERMMRVSAVVAASENGVIGKDGGLPWHVSSDLKLFKEITMGKPVIMGRRTWESLPRKPLPGRRNIVITRQQDYEAEGAELAFGGRGAGCVQGRRRFRSSAAGRSMRGHGPD